MLIIKQIISKKRFWMTAKKFSGVLAPSVITLAIICFFYAIYGIFPFGDKTVSWCDMNQQTIPLLMDFKDILDGKNGIFYSNANAGGMNFWGVFLFFLASPFYLSVKFVEKSDIIYLVNILLALKLSLCSFTAAIYFKYINKELKPCYVNLLSVMYALCGYGIMYFQTLVWIDIMYLFPLLVIACERLCTKNKWGMYFFTLVTMMAVNFYLSYMIVIYIMLSVPILIFFKSKKEEKIKVAVSFVMSSFAALLITAPVWLCAFLQISDSARSGNVLQGIMYSSLFENLGNKIAVLAFTVLGFAVLPFVIKSGLCRNRRVLYNLFMLLFLMIPVIFDSVNKVWHTGNYQSFPLRYGFIIVMIMLELVACYFETLSESSKTSKKIAMLMIVPIIAFAALTYFIIINNADKLSGYVKNLKINTESLIIIAILSVFAVAIYSVLIILKNKGFLSHRIFSVLCATVFLTEFSLNFCTNLGYAVNDGEIFKKSAFIEASEDDNRLYRTKTEKKYLHVNMLGGLGFNSFSHYTSLTAEKYMTAMKKLGYSSYWMEVGSYGGTCLSDAFLSVNKSIGFYYDFKSYYSVPESNNELQIADNSIYCPAGIISKNDPEDFSEFSYTDRYSIQKQLAGELFGNSSMLKKYSYSNISEGTITSENGKISVTVSEPDMSKCQVYYEFDVDGNQQIYFDLFGEFGNNLTESYYSSARVYVNGICITDDYPTQKSNGIISLGEFRNEKVSVLIEFKKNISVTSLCVFGIDTDKLSECVKQIDGCDVYKNKNGIYASCEGNDGEYLYLSVPYENGMSAYINGKKTILYKVNDSFCAVKLENGENKIELKFFPSGFKISIILLVSGILLLIFMIKKGMKILCNHKIFRLSGVLICRFCFAFVFVFVYILPVALRLATKISQLLSK